METLESFPRLHKEENCRSWGTNCLPTLALAEASLRTTMPKGGRGAAPDIVLQDLSCRTRAGIFWLTAELSEKVGRNPA